MKSVRSTHPLDARHSFASPSARLSLPFSSFVFLPHLSFFRSLHISFSLLRTLAQLARVCEYISTLIEYVYLYTHTYSYTSYDSSRQSALTLARASPRPLCTVQSLFLSLSSLLSPLLPSVHTSIALSTVLSHSSPRCKVIYRSRSSRSVSSVR